MKMTKMTPVHTANLVAYEVVITFKMVGISNDSESPQLIAACPKFNADW